MKVHLVFAAVVALVALVVVFAAVDKARDALAVATPFQTSERGDA